MYKEYNLVGTREDGGTETIESYDNVKDAMVAYYLIAENGKHYNQNLDINGEKQEVDISEYVSFNIDVSMTIDFGCINFKSVEDHIDFYR